MCAFCEFGGGDGGVCDFWNCCRSLSVNDQVKAVVANYIGEVNGRGGSSKRERNSGPGPGKFLGGWVDAAEEAVGGSGSSGRGYSSDETGEEENRDEHLVVLQGEVLMDRLYGYADECSTTFGAGMIFRHSGREIDHAGHSLSFEVGHEMSTMEKLKIFDRVMPAPPS